jgi:spectinomycin phosphotransferase/16S rRNA (guanine(1405)-N(7))-methyltransferase
VAAALRDGWGLEPQVLDYVPLGFGSYHWRAEAGGSWFVTVDDLSAKRSRRDDPPDATWQRLSAALATARALADAGLTFVAAPRRTGAGDVLWRVDDRYALALYEWVEGETHVWGPYPDRGERRAVLDLLVTLHGVPAALHEIAHVDDLAIAYRDRLAAALEDLAARWDTGPHGEPARRLLDRHAAPLTSALDRYDDEAAALAREGAARVLTHGEPHRANTITTAAGVVLIDWDTALVSYPERDLWALGREDPAILDEYAVRAGFRPRAAALDLYAKRWDLTDVAIYAGRFHAPHRESEDTRLAFDYLRYYLTTCAPLG